MCSLKYNFNGLECAYAHAEISDSCYDNNNDVLACSLISWLKILTKMSNIDNRFDLMIEHKFAFWDAPIALPLALPWAESVS